MKKTKKQPEIIEDVTIVDAGAEGMSIAKPDDKVVFIPFGAPGDIVDLQVFKKKSNCFDGKILNIKKPSDKRVEPVCQHFGLCGGCKWQHLDYQWQLFYKQKQVKDNFDRIAKIEYPEISPILGCENSFITGTSSNTASRTANGSPTAHPSAPTAKRTAKASATISRTCSTASSTSNIAICKPTRRTTSACLSRTSQ